MRSARFARVVLSWLFLLVVSNALAGRQVHSLEQGIEEKWMMTWELRLGCLAFAVMWGVSADGSARAAELKVGDKAPAFTLKGSDGKTYKLADFRGKQAVVIAWYPLAFTGG